jgi:hypothetical protein
VGMPMLSIHARFERFPTPYASCDTSGHFRSFFTEKTSENEKIVENQNNLALCLELIIQGHEKIRPFKVHGFKKSSNFLENIHEFKKMKKTKKKKKK